MLDKEVLVWDSLCMYACVPLIHPLIYLWRGYCYFHLIGKGPKAQRACDMPKVTQSIRRSRFCYKPRRGNLLLSHCLWQRSANIFSKGQIVIILGFTGHPVSVTTTELCHCSMKATIDNMQMNGCDFILTKLCSQKQVAGQIGPMGCSLTAPALWPWGLWTMVAHSSWTRSHRGGHNLTRLGQ